MLFTVTNTSTDITLYPAAVNGNLCTMIRPGETRIIEAKAKDELLLSYPQYLTVVGSTTDPYAAVTVNKSLTTAWQLIDLGYYYGTLEVKNDSSSAVTVQYSLSGFTAPNTAPPVNSIGALTQGEAATLFLTVKPERYIYASMLSGTGSIQITAS